MTRALRVLAAPMALLLALAAPTAAPAQPAPAAVELVSQSPVTGPRDTVQVTVRVPGVPEDGNLRVAIHSRVRSRSELAASMEGDSLRNVAFQTVIPLATLPSGAGGARTFPVSLDPATGGPALSGGVYPLELIARSADNAELATIVTHLVVPPAEAGSPPLAVASLAHLATPPRPVVDGQREPLDDAQVAALAALAQAAGAVEAARATLVVGPETLDALAASGEAGEAVLAELRAAASSLSVLRQPYVAISLDALSAAGLSAETLRQVQHGQRVTAAALGTDPVATTWVAGPDLGADGLRLLPRLGATHAVVPSSLVEPLPDGVLDLSLAQPFLLDPPRSEHAEGTGTVTALAVDPAIPLRLAAEGTPALVANRTTAELATIWFEQPGIPRAAVVPLDADLAPGVARAVLAGIAGSPVFAPSSLDQAFATASPLLDPVDDPVHRPLTPVPPTPFSSGDAAGVRGARASLESARGMVGRTSPLLPPVDAQLLLATADQLDPAARRSQAVAVQGTVDDLEATVTGPVTFTLTLTSREGTVPLTLRNDSGVPLHVVVHLDSAKLDFPEGADLPVVLEEPVTRLDIPVKARASGASALAVRVTTPDGREELVSSRYTVRSTAVAGAGLVLGVGAGLFLLVWWARHWRNTRRNARLVPSPVHPATGADADG